MKRTISRGVLALLLGLGGLGATGFAPPPTAAQEGKADPRVYDVGAKVAGKTYKEWSVVWWQWALAIKKGRNPIRDKDGTFAGEGQNGPVWFLAGNMGGKTTRKCTIPAGKPIFFPVVNDFETAAPDKADEKKLLAAAKAFIDGAVDLQATLDEKPIAGLERFRVASAAFSYSAPRKVSEAPFRGTAGINTATSDGYWIMLKPLPAGKHTLRFAGKIKQEGKAPIEFDIAYDLTVAEKK